MLVKDVLDQAMEDNAVDLQALIMFLVFEKQVLDMESSSSELDLYFLPKHRKRMNKEINTYKRQMNITYPPNVYAIKVNKRYRTIYLLAHSKSQAMLFCRKMLYEPLETTICDDDMLMTSFSRNGGVNISVKDLKNNKIPCFLGGF